MGKTRPGLSMGSRGHESEVTTPLTLTIDQVVDKWSLNQHWLSPRGPSMAEMLDQLGRKGAGLLSVLTAMLIT